jgi:microcystin-dependent protein
MDSYIGEIRLMAFDYAPRGWATCDGQELSITTNQVLFAVLGTRYGGNGTTTFKLPDLRGRIPVHAGDGLQLGVPVGEESHTLTQSELPTHQHQLLASTSEADTALPAGAVLAAANNGFAPPTQAQTTLAPGTVATRGNGQAHQNLHPYLVLSWCIALEGLFPEAD